MTPRQSVRYLIVGGGMTADAAVAGIREHDPTGSIAVVGAEAHPPYKRPPLTKSLWTGAEESSIWLHATEAAGVDLRTGHQIVELDLPNHSARDDAGDVYGYERLLLATGATPRRIPDSDGVVYFRSLDDYHEVRSRAVAGARVVVIGGGFIGSELAAALSGAGCEVTIVFPDPGIGWRLFPAELAHFLNEYYRERGIDVLPDEKVDAAGATSATLASGRVLDADLVLAGLGVEPATDLAATAGLTVDNGIVVDAYGRCEGHDDVFAAGDVASFPALALGTRMRVEHEDHARTHGRAVGENMAGAEQPYDHLPLFYSDLFDLGYEAVGEVDSRHAQLASWVEPNRQGIVAYVDRASVPRGFLLWNTWDRVDTARGLIRDGRPLAADELQGLFA